MARSVTYGLASAISDGSITGAKIADGAITNVKVNAAAAIDGTKLAGSGASLSNVSGGSCVTSATLQASANTLRTYAAGSAAAFSKVKEIQIQVAGTIRVDYDLAFDQNVGGGFGAEGQVYVNGAGVGALNRNNTTGFITYSDPTITVKAGDLVQLYIHQNFTSSVATASAQNFRLYYTPTNTNGFAVITN